jgi:voltage-gated potassium channel
MTRTLIYFPDSTRRFLSRPAGTWWVKRSVNLMGRITVLFLRRLWQPALVFGAFCLVCVAVYMRLEGLSAIDAFFWIFHPHAIDYRAVRTATKLFSSFVYVGVFAFQVWIAERVLVTIFNRQGLEAWKSMVNDANIAKLKNHFIICGYGQVGRTVVDQLTRLEIPFVLIETNEGLCRELLNNNVLVIQGDAKRHDVLLQAGIQRARGICIVIDNDADNLYITVTARSLNAEAKIITRAGQQRYANAIRNSGADEVIIPEYEGGLMTGRMIQKWYPAQGSLE